MRKTSGLALRLLLFVLTSFVFHSENAADEPSRPNILLIVADDLGWSHIGYQNPQVKTPHMDQLANHGVKLNQHYVAPSCSPTRAALLSGRYWSRFGLIEPTDDPVFPSGTLTLASMLKSCGYRTHIAGKWHLGSMVEYGPRKFGFDHSYGSLVGGMGPYTHQKKHANVSVLCRNDRQIEEEGHITDLIQKEVVSWIQNSGAEPFFIFVSFTSPHFPISEPDAWMDMYKEAPSIGHQLYWASISHMDDAIGKIVNAVEKAGKKDNTLVLFLSDNGAPGQYNQAYQGQYIKATLPSDNKPFRGRKQTLYEGGIRTPAFIHWPARLKTPAELETPLSVTDWMPTFAEICRYQPSPESKWDGRSILNVLGGAPATLGEERALYFKSNNGCALRVGDWKLLQLHPEKDPTNLRYELYNLKSDPSEATNLLRNHPDIVERLKLRLSQEQAKDDDAVVPKPAKK